MPQKFSFKYQFSKFNLHTSSQTEFAVNLQDSLVNCKETIVKLSNIQFQSYWPILHKLLGEGLLKTMVQEYDLKKEYFNSVQDERVNFMLRDSMGKSAFFL